jgi:hypothetical protein
VKERKFSHHGKDYVVRSLSDGTVWKAGVFEAGSQDCLYDLQVRISIIIDARDTAMGEYMEPDVLVEQCEADFKRLVEDWPKIVAERTRRRGLANKP